MDRRIRWRAVGEQLDRADDEWRTDRTALAGAGGEHDEQHGARVLQDGEQHDGDATPGGQHRRQGESARVQSSGVGESFSFLKPSVP